MTKILGLILTGALVTGGASAFGAEGKEPLRYDRIELRDGRILSNVIVRSYDAESERVLVVAGRKAMMVAVGEMYPPISEEVREAPESGRTVSIVPARPAPAGPAAEPPPDSPAADPGPAS